MNRSIEMWLTVALLIATALSPSVSGQQSLAAARDLYASASYEEALNLLNTLKTSGGYSLDEGVGIEQYRAFCLLALGRATEAERAIEEVVAAEPMYQPGEGDASPRVRAAFTDVRRRMLPAIAQQKYAMAKATFDRKEYAAAAGQFRRTIEVIDDPATAASKEAGLADLRVLASGFLELSLATAAPPPAEEAPAPAPSVPAAAQEPRIYMPGDAGVTPPVPIKQDVPRWPPAAGPINSRGRGILEVSIDEAGNVEQAVMRVPLGRVFDPLLVAATKTWRYRPAMKAGAPVKYKKTIQITVGKD